MCMIKCGNPKILWFIYQSLSMFIRVYHCSSTTIGMTIYIYQYIYIYVYIDITILYYNIISWPLLGCVLCFETNTKKTKIKGNKAWEINWGHRTFWHIVAHRTSTYIENSIGPWLRQCCAIQRIGLRKNPWETTIFSNEMCGLPINWVMVCGVSSCFMFSLP